MREPNATRRQALIGTAAVAASLAVPALPVAMPAAAALAPKSFFAGRGLIGFEPPHPWGSWAWMNAIEEAIWWPTEDLERGICPCALCCIERDGM
jgi:hypothetical protein